MLAEQCSAKLVSVKSSPQKIGLIANAIRGMQVQEAAKFLLFSQKRPSKAILSLLHSAIANAENNHSMDIDNLFIFEVRIGKALTLKRFRARARGRGSRIFKPFSRIEIILKERA